MQKFLNNKSTAVYLPAVLGLAGSYLCAVVFEQYGWTLFLGLPVGVTFLSALCWSYGRDVGLGSAYGIGVLSLLVLGLLIMVFAIDGLICLVMALPLALVLGVAGAALGRWLGTSMGGRGGTTVAIIVVLCFPVLVGFENAVDREIPVREVTTVIEIDAPIEKVWETVIAFPEIEAAPKGIFRLGIAYPISARIEGEGVGATRYCTFSTGSFVEPITVWDGPHHLAFDVSENPAPMRELSIYGDVHAPHLHGHMVSSRK